jgi:uncharacterized protein involved in exopolysaccharide biosynthesis
MEAHNKEGRHLSPFTIWKIIKRRWFYLVLPPVLITLGVAYYTGKLPVRYRAQALIASQAAVPETYLTGRADAAAVNVQEHLRTIREVIFSPAVLETVVQEFHLYDVAHDRGMEQAANLVKPRIQIQVDSPDAFYLGFEGDSPQQVTQVANRLAGLFVERTSNIRVWPRSMAFWIRKWTVCEVNSGRRKKD